MSHPSNVITFPARQRAGNKIGRTRAKRHSKPTKFIRSRQAKAYERAVGRAVALEAKRKASFVFVTIWLGGITHQCQDDAAAVEWILDEVRRWFLRQGEDYYALWAVENGDIKGVHLHALFSCRKGLRLSSGKRKGFYSWLWRLVKPRPRSKALRRRKTKYGQDCPGCGRARDMQHLVLCYFLKGGSDEVRERHGINLCHAATGEYPQDQGAVTGKRIGYSWSLGDKANRVRVGGAHRSQPQPAPAAATFLASDKS